MTVLNEKKMIIKQEVGYILYRGLTEKRGKKMKEKKIEGMVSNIQEASIQMSKKTRDRLKGFKIFRRETYDEELNRLMDICKEVKE